MHHYSDKSTLSFIMCISHKALKKDYAIITELKRLNNLVKLQINLVPYYRPNSSFDKFCLLNFPILIKQTCQTTKHEYFDNVGRQKRHLSSFVKWLKNFGKFLSWKDFPASLSEKNTKIPAGLHLSLDKVNLSWLKLNLEKMTNIDCQARFGNDKFYLWEWQIYFKSVAFAGVGCTRRCAIVWLRWSRCYKSFHVYMKKTGNF